MDLVTRLITRKISMIRFLLMLFVTLNMVSCKKTADRSCLKATGKIISKTISPGSFNKLYLMEHIEYVLVQDSISFVQLEGGENLLGFIDCTISSGELTIQNNNKCKFLRYKNGKIKAEVHFTQLTDIIFQGTEQLTNKKTWTFNYLNIVLKDTGGSMNLSGFQGSYLNLVNTHGWGDITMNGSVNYFRADMDGNGFFDSRNFLVKDSVSITSVSSTISKLNASNCLLKAQLTGSGDVWYYGIPMKIEKQEMGTGRLVDKN